MVTVAGTRGWVIVARAALRLAAVYALGVAVLALPFAFIVGTNQVRSEVFAGVGVLAALGFGVGFAALGIARRVGFVALWLLLLTWWLSMVIPARFGGPEFAFLLWTLLAVPLYVMAAIGLSVSQAGSASWALRVELLVTGAFWLGVSLLALRHPAAPSDVMFFRPRALADLDLIGYVCLAWPVVITVRELWRVVRAVRRPLEPSAA